MDELKSVSLDAICEGLKTSVKPVNILWQAPDTIAFIARGRPHRSEFHADPSDEVMYMIKGVMNLHYLDSAGGEKIAVVKEGEIIYCPAGVKHSPRFSPDSFLLVLERKRKPEEMDRFFWYCESCKAPIHEAVRHVADYREDPVSRVYEEFYDSSRKCDRCGHVTAKPDGAGTGAGRSRDGG